MRSFSRNQFLRVALGGVFAASAPRLAAASDPRERLLVSLIALRRGEMVADEAQTYRPFHQHREQVLTLDVGAEGVPRSLLVTLWDRDAGGVRVMCCALGRDGQHVDRRDFIMYPLLDKAAARTERLRLPVRLAAEGAGAALMAPDEIELVITMNRVLRAS